MKSVSIKNLSLLGVVLMAASAVTAAIMPDKTEGKRVKNGQLLGNSASVGGPAGVLSCKAVLNGQQCTATVGTLTTAAAADSYTVINNHNYQTIGNTSQDGLQSTLQFIS